MKVEKICELEEVDIEFLKYLKEKTSPDSDFGYPFRTFDKSNGHDVLEEERRGILYRLSRSKLAKKVGNPSLRIYRITEQGLDFLEDLES